MTVTLAPLAVIVPDAVPLWPTTTLPRPRVVGVTESVPAVAVVQFLTVEPLQSNSKPSSTIVMLPVLVPVAVGVNFALNVQLAPGARVSPGSLQVPMPPQVKSADIASLVNVNVAFPVFVMVVVSTALVCRPRRCRS